jgi:hypothetical protein
MTKVKTAPGQALASEVAAVVAAVAAMPAGPRRMVAEAALADLAKDFRLLQADLKAAAKPVKRKPSI